MKSVLLIIALIGLAFCQPPTIDTKCPQPDKKCVLKDGDCSDAAKTFCDVGLYCNAGKCETPPTAKPTTYLNKGDKCNASAPYCDPTKYLTCSNFIANGTCIELTFGWVGDGCNATARCWTSLSCVGGKCQKFLSAKKGEDCNSVMDCVPGLECDAGKCADAKVAALTACKANSECGNGQCYCTKKDGTSGLCGGAALPAAKCTAAYAKYTAKTIDGTAAAKNGIEEQTCVNTCLAGLGSDWAKSIEGYLGGVNTAGCKYTAMTCPTGGATAATAATAKATGAGSPASVVVASFALICAMILALF